MPTEDELPVSGESFAEVFDAALLHRGLSLPRVRARLEAVGAPVSIATLSYWRSGRSVPEHEQSMRAVASLETILDLEPGRLVGALGGRAARGRTSSRRASFNRLSPQLFAMDPAQTALINELDLGIPGRLSRLTSFHRATYRGSRVNPTWDSITLWRAERSGVTGFPVVHQQPSGAAGSPVVEARGMCTVGRVASDPSRNLTVTELLFPHPLAAGEVIQTHTITYEHPTGVDSPKCQVSTAHTLHMTILEVVFEDMPSPTRIWRTTHNNWLGDAVTIEPLSPTRGMAQTLQTSGPAPVIVGLRWLWDESMS